MSFFNRDLSKEQIISEYLNDLYYDLKLNFIRNKDLDLQLKGVDLIYQHKGTDFFIDEKAQLDYINIELPTFTFELSYLKNGENKLGWLIDQTKITTHYFLITSIYAKDKNDLLKGFTSCKITSVNRNKLNTYLNTIGLTIEQLNCYQNNIRKADNKKTKIKIDELNAKTQGLLYYSNHLSEKPINLQLRLDFLIKKKIAKQIYPKAT
ncbi:hypothetical protein [Ichthyenterobacterium magnum]|uniref:Uncharacterized protein n=1 Tax=Ichthyenterobacterium magnum TaxID=1230530 RepID=A0A420DW80_9FLAO|nr:hypothetical protein [Ichthyenterobacterium magnum]RKE98476.1 hypothetical protein BXY80_0564 [Ichthyenterobacterium magnum]